MQKTYGMAVDAAAVAAAAVEAQRRMRREPGDQTI